MRLILASSSESRLKLLRAINIIPDQIYAPEINETPKKQELPHELSIRLAKEKVLKSLTVFENCYLISADTVCSVGRKVLPKAINREVIIETLKTLSGRRHKIYTSVCIAKKQNQEVIIRQKTESSVIKFKRLTKREIEEYANLNLGLNTASGYALEEIYIEKFILWVKGSISNIMGLPIYKVDCLLKSLGFYNKRTCLK